MAITVEQLLAQVRDKDMRCVVGFRGLDNAISSFTIIDTPNIVQWLKGGEFVASLGYVTSIHPEMLGTLIHDLASKGCAGIGIKMHGYYDEIPQEYIDQGNMLNMPIIELPYSMRFSDLAYHIHQNIFQKDMSVMAQIHSVYQSLTTLVLSDASIEHMLYNISQAVGNPVVLLNKDFAVIASEIPAQSGLELNGLLFLEADKPLMPRKQLKEVMAYYEKTPYITYSMTVPQSKADIRLSFVSIQSESERWGYLVIPETMKPLDGDSHRILENITSVVSIYFMKNKFLPALSAGKNSFLDLVLLNPQGTRDSIRYYSKLFGFDYHSKRICLDLIISEEARYSYKRRKSIYSLLDVTFDALRQTYGIQPYTIRYGGHFLAFLLFPEATSTEQAKEVAESVAQACLRKIEENGLTVEIGISSCSQDIGQIPAAYRQAVEIVPLGRQIQPGKRLHFFERLKVYYTLSSTLTREELQDLASVLQDLYELDQDGKSEYLLTLERLINNKFNISKTAAEMYIHRNSMNYRLRRIQDVLGVDLEDPEEVLKIQLGLHALKLLALKEK